MRKHIPFAAMLSLSLLSLCGCRSSAHMETSNAKTEAQLNAIAGATANDAGATLSSAPVTPDEVGQSMRAGAAQAPRDH